MTYRPIQKYAAVATVLSMFVSNVYAAEQAETERLIRRITPPIAAIEATREKKDEISVDSFYEESDILQGNRTGHWSELTNNFGYSHQNIHSYISISELERFDQKDYTANIGSYFNLKDSYLRLEAGFGWDVDYIYKFQSIAEYSHRLFKDVFWQAGYTYRAYGTDDTHLIYPGLIYYFGDSYMSADYGISFIESRDTAHLGIIKGSFAITKFLDILAGTAFGERLYDINELNARKEFGYILFTGLNVKIYKDISCRVGYSYSMEKPKFIKRSLNFGLGVKF